MAWFFCSGLFGIIAFYIPLHGSTAHVHRTRAMLAALFGILGALGKTGAHISGC